MAKAAPDPAYRMLRIKLWPSLPLFQAQAMFSARAKPWGNCQGKVAAASWVVFRAVRKVVTSGTSQKSTNTDITSRRAPRVRYILDIIAHSSGWKMDRK
jgi:hypothetical protein